MCSMQTFSANFTGLELEDGGGRGTSGWLYTLFYSSYNLLVTCQDVTIVYMNFCFSFYRLIENNDLIAGYYKI